MVFFLNNRKSYSYGKLEKFERTSESVLYLHKILERLCLSYLDLFSLPQEWAIPSQMVIGPGVNFWGGFQDGG
jgi:hypothetical protein